MAQVQLPTGRVGDTAQRDLLRALVRSTDPGPARPTKTVAPPAGFAAMGLMTFASAVDGTPSGETLTLVGGWSLTTDASGALIALHEDGSSQLLAARTVPTGEDINDG